MKIAIGRGLVDEDLAVEQDSDAEVVDALRRIAEGLPRPVALHEATATLVVYRRDKGLTLDAATDEAHGLMRLDSLGRAIEAGVRSPIPR